MGVVGRSVQFQSKEGESAWLKGAITGCMKGQFSWAEHGEEIRAECAGKLKITYMGSNLILIQSEMEEETTKVIKRFEEWAEFWLEWWRKWAYTDVNQNRKIWTKWISVPLQAWSSRFFGLGCVPFGRFISMHGVTESKSRLDEAFVEVSTGMAQVDRMIECRIDGANFAVRVEEIRCREHISELFQSSDSEPEAKSEYSDLEEWDDEDSVEARLSSNSKREDSGEHSVEWRAGVTIQVPTSMERGL